MPKQVIKENFSLATETEPPRIKLVFGINKQVSPSVATKAPLFNASAVTVSKASTEDSPIDENEEYSDHLQLNHSRKSLLSPTHLQIQEEPLENPSTPASLDEELHLISSTSSKLSSRDDSPSIHDLLPSPDRSSHARKSSPPIKAVQNFDSLKQKIAHQVIRLDFHSNRSQSETEDKTDEYLHALIEHYRNQKNRHKDRMRGRHERILEGRIADQLPKTARRLVDLKNEPTRIVIKRSNVGKARKRKSK